MLTELFRLVIRGERGESKTVEVAAHHLPKCQPQLPTKPPRGQKLTRSPSPKKNHHGPKRRGSSSGDCHRKPHPVKRGSSFCHTKSYSTYDDDLSIDDQIFILKREKEVSSLFLFNCFGVSHSVSAFLVNSENKDFILIWTRIPGT